MSKADWIYTLIKKFGLEAEVVDKIFRDNPELDKDPVKRIHELEDEPGNCYLWNVDMTDAQINEFLQKINSEFTRRYNRNPKALHLVKNDVNSISELDPGTVKSQVEPWLNNKEVGE